MGQPHGAHSWCRVPTHSLTPPLPYKHPSTKIIAQNFLVLYLAGYHCFSASTQLIVSPSIILSRGGKRIALHPQYHHTILTRQGRRQDFCFWGANLAAKGSPAGSTVVGIARGGPGNAPPENFEILGCLKHILRQVETVKGNKKSLTQIFQKYDFLLSFYWQIHSLYIYNI